MVARGWSCGGARACGLEVSSTMQLLCLFLLPMCETSRISIMYIRYLQLRPLPRIRCSDGLWTGAKSQWPYRIPGRAAAFSLFLETRHVTQSEARWSETTCDEDFGRRSIHIIVSDVQIQCPHTLHSSPATILSVATYDNRRSPIFGSCRGRSGVDKSPRSRHKGRRQQQQ